MLAKKVIVVILLALAAISPFMSSPEASKARPADVHRVF
jgi:hypothetical protein